MLFKSVDITDNLGFELRKEDGLPQLIINSDILSITIGVDEQLTVNKLRELAKGLNDLSDYIEEFNSHKL